MKRVRIRINGAPSPARRQVLRTRVGDDRAEKSSKPAEDNEDFGRGHGSSKSRTLGEGDGSNLHPNFLRSGRPGAGRPPGVPNKLPRSIKEAIVTAAMLHGEDGEGKDGLIGYMSMLAREDRAVFGSLLRRIMPVQVKADVNTSAIVLEVMKVVGHGDQRANGHTGNEFWTRRLNHLTRDDA